MAITKKNYLIYLVILVVVLIAVLYLLPWIMCKLDGTTKEQFLQRLREDLMEGKEPSTAIAPSIKEGFGNSDGLNWTAYYGYFADDIYFASKYGKWMEGQGSLDLSSLNSMTQNRILENRDQHYFSIQLTGYFVPNVTGYWKFRTSSDDASYLWLNKDITFSNVGASPLTSLFPKGPAVNNGGLHGWATRESASIYLVENTFYPIVIQMGENWGGYGLKVEWLPPGGGWTSSGNGMLYSGLSLSQPNASFSKGLNCTIYTTYIGAYGGDDVNFSSNGDRFKKYLTLGGITQLHDLGKMTKNVIIGNVGYYDADGPPNKGIYNTGGTTTHNFSVELKGYFLPNVSGTWQFFTSSDDASYLWIGDKANSGWNSGNATVWNGNPHGMDTKSGSANLEAGNYYPIRIQMGEQGGGFNFRVGFCPPKGNWTCNGEPYLFYSSQMSLGEKNNDITYEGTIAP